MDEKVLKAWSDFLNPAVTRPRLIAASVYITAFEVLKDAVVSRLRNFYWTGFDEHGEIIDSSYTTKVLSRNRSPVYASLDWLKESGAIAEDDMQAFERAKECRNRLAHGLLEVVASAGLPEDFEVRFEEMVALLNKIETWWLKEVEIPTSLEPPHEGADPDVVPGSLLALQVLCHVALGSEEDSRRYLDEFDKQRGKGNA
jgi:hypothetical protein